MRAIPFSYVLADAVELWSGDAAASVPDATIFSRRIRKRATEFWEQFYWPEWTVMEKRQFRPSWNAVAPSVAGQAYYSAVELAYYLCLVGNTGVAPTDGNGTVNTAYWALAQGDYSGLPPYDPSAAYTQGAQVYFPNSQTAFQLIAPAASGVDPTNAGTWAPLVEFLRNIDFTQAWETNTITEARKVYDLNPWIHPNANEVPFIVTSQGIICRGTPATVWVEFRLMCPRWAGPNYDATATYAAGSQVYFGSGLSWDFYQCGSAGAGPGASPASNPELWTVVGFPYVFREAAAQAAYGDMLKVDGQADKAGPELNEASRLLRLEFDKIERQQGQTRPLKVVNRANANAAW